MRLASAGSTSLQGHKTPPGIDAPILSKTIITDWKGSALHKESTLHQLSPYIGKIKSSMARTLITEFTRKNQTVYDPYSGSGTIAFESWAAGRKVIANDLSPYAFVLTRAKLFPRLSLEDALEEIHVVAKRVRSFIELIDLREIPKWVRSFFHPDTLREVVAWSQVLRARRSHFLLSCLLGILHHQRPGFLSYPSSHTVPYLRQKNFPRDRYPEFYEYRPLQERLEKKTERALKRIPYLDCKVERNCHMRDASKFAPKRKIDAIITSPPYMRQLDYGRDNRLRLWFLGLQDWKSLDLRISPSELKFFKLISSCLKLWRDVVTPKGLCVLILGDAHSRLYNLPLADAVARVAIREIGGYSLLWKYTEPIPSDRRVRRSYSGNLTETVLVLRNER
jgi:DNA modification methylase